MARTKPKTLFCPHCGSGFSSVVDTRNELSGGGTYRRRKCGTCGKNFTTVEQVVEAYRIVYRKEGVELLP